VSESLLLRLDDEHRDVLRRCGSAAAGRGARAYLVGGSVRDLVLQRPHDDLDVVVEGDGLGVAQDIARALGGELTRHHAFQTAMVMTPRGLRLDVATARREDYPRPGQLPRIVAGTLDEDLERRDFTINAMAISLQSDGFGDFIDPQHGRADLERGLLRVMHERSFADDPTRILRALRFALRFGHALEVGTHRQMAEAIAGGYLDEVSGDRLRKEVRLTFGEVPVAGPIRLQDEGVLASLQEGLRADAARLGRLQELLAATEETAGALGSSPDAGGNEHGDDGGDGGAAPGDAPDDPGTAAWTLVLACCATDLGQQDRWQLARRLRLSRAERSALIESGAPWQKARAALLADPGRLPADSDIERALRPLSTGALLVAASAGAPAEPTAEPVLRYLRELRQVRPLLDGDDLQQLGVPPGPKIGELLEKLRAARLDGAVNDRAGERRLVAAWMAAEPH
jgi:tRNA nucleotidyltransferase (CCA-adding enzyme)